MIPSPGCRSYSPRGAATLDLARVERSEESYDLGRTAFPHAAHGARSSALRRVVTRPARRKHDAHPARRLRAICDTWISSVPA
jgi:hypothetical protein